MRPTDAEACLLRTVLATLLAVGLPLAAVADSDLAITKSGVGGGEAG